MRAVAFRRYGAPGELVVLERPRPVPGRKEVLIRVAAAGAGAGSLAVGDDIVAMASPRQGGL